MTVQEKLAQTPMPSRAKYAACRYHINRFFANLEKRGGVAGSVAALIVQNEIVPENSYIVTEKL